MRIENDVFCDGCGVEIHWAPVKAGQQEYCCNDCRDGFECSCGSRMEEEDYPRGRGTGAGEGVIDGTSSL